VNPDETQCYRGNLKTWGEYAAIRRKALRELIDQPASSLVRKCRWTGQ
jgi:hypothetical protein|tara:strand:- start:55 stop:198 length:144 start_codon:yes stop_codon:yes gene_type:complete